MHEVSADTVHLIEAELAELEKEPVHIQEAVIVRSASMRPFVCGIYDTGALRARRLVTTFMWRQDTGFIPGTAHDARYACMDFSNPVR